METKNNFDGLVCNITSVQDVLQTQAAHAINLALTTRNWLIGYYIVEYEQNGEDRAQYGEQLLKKLAKRIGRKGLGERRLYEFRQMYSTYPNLAMEVVAYLHNGSDTNILRSATAKLQIESAENEKLRLATAKLSESTEAWTTPPEKLFYRLSATHLILLSGISEPLKRAFYEQEAIKGCWIVMDAGETTIDPLKPTMVNAGSEVEVKDPLDVILQEFNNRWFNGWEATPNDQKMKLVSVAQAVAADEDYQTLVVGNPDQQAVDALMVTIIDRIMRKKRKGDNSLYKEYQQNEGFKADFRSVITRMLGDLDYLQA